jgi:hypothetical protein
VDDDNEKQPTSTPSSSSSSPFPLSPRKRAKLHTHPQLQYKQIQQTATMATQPNPTPTTVQTPGATFVAMSRPLYGILVSEKSFLLGKRSQVLQHQGNYLAHRIIGDRLPAELCNEIGSELTTLLVKDAADLWKKMENDQVFRGIKFGTSPAAVATTLTGSERVGRRQYNRLSRCKTAQGTVRVRDTAVVVGRIGSAEGAEQRYVHLSAALVRPSISMLVPREAKFSGGPSLTLANGGMRVVNIPDGPTEVSGEAIYVGWNSGEGGSAKRLVQFDDVEASIRAWNQKLIERLVSGLELRVVDVRGVDGTGGGLKPEFRTLQQVYWN